MSVKKTELWHRHSNNPIITPDDLAYEANTVFNAGATQVGNETILLLRVEDRRGISHLTVARSDNGVDSWRIDPHPTFAPDPARPEEKWGVEDPRITYLEDEGVWAICYTAYSEVGPLVSLATTTDFKQFERRGPVMPPEDKDAALFPVRFDGRWAMIHRPMPNMPSADAHIWISFSPDLKHWGDHQILLAARSGAWWDGHKIGLSPPPLRTDQGWLMMYHGVRTTASGAIYRLGLALFDLADPTKLLHRADEWVLAPSEDYELFGDVDKAIFPCGWVLQDDTVRLYYGAADSRMACAEGSLSALLNWLERQGQVEGDDL